MTEVVLLMGLAASGRAATPDASLRKLEAVGKSIFEQDRAASLATDRVLESMGRLPEAVRGWVTVSSDGGLQVVFVEKSGDAYCSALSVIVDADGAGPLRRSETCDPLTAEEGAMFLARQTAISALRARCSEAYNTVVMPYEGKKGAWAVYLLSATSEAGKVVVGGHVRVVVSSGGSEVLEYQKLSNTCLTLDLVPPGGGKPVALFVTHVLDDHPIETHVYLSLLHKVKFFVVTETAMWAVEKGKIRLLMDGEDFKAYMGKAKAAAEKKKSGGDE
jgi:hypothetical protein